MSTGDNSEGKFFYEAPSKYRKRYLKNNNNVILRSKKNVIKSKCHRVLRNKLKKYKLRRDGAEDPDVLDISESFQLSLKLKSPKKENIDPNENYDNLKVTNYLFKMVRHKKINSSIIEIDSDVESKIADKDKITDTRNESVFNNKNTNAFALMMNSRNKSIGTNSPGKKKKNEDIDFSERDAQKAVKLKRSIALHKMAESRGSIQRKELEVLKDKCIQKKMNDRAHKLKDMLTRGGKSKKENHESSSNAKAKSDMKESNESIFDDKEKTKINLKEVDNVKVLPLMDIDLFKTPKSKVNNILKEDEEFLNKLSPSLKNRNMLCYFKKVDKPVNVDEKDYIDNSNDESNENIIKVKFISNKKKNKKKKLSLKNKNSVYEGIDDISTNIKLNVNNDIKIDATSLCDTEDIFKGTELHEQIDDNIVVNFILDEENPEPEKKELEVTSDTPKRKRKRNIHTELITKQNVETDLNIKENRPKRNIKKPTTYDIESSSSDENIHILTPKKKRVLKTHKSSGKDKSNEAKKKTESKDDMETIVILGSDDDNKNNKIMNNKPKIAPLFMPKPQIDAAVLEARQKFLQSGVPEQLKKIQARIKMPVLENDFFITTHVQQFTNDTSNNTTLKYHYNDSEDDDLDFNIEDYNFHLECDVKNEQKPSSGFRHGVKSSLQLIKQSYPEFPVYRTYNLLKNKSNKEGRINTNLDNSSEVIDQINLGTKIEDPSHLNWTEKYRITFARDIIGNFESIKELKRWLQTWQDNEASSKRNLDDSDSDCSDFYYNSDADSKDSMKGVNNLLILTGPVGCGKTTSVYAVAAELSIKVIEVNVSSKRTGKIIMQDLQEATQSHKVNRTKSSSTENSQNSQEMKTEGKKLKNLQHKKSISGLISKTKKFKTYSKAEPLVQQTTSYSQEISKTEMSLVLIDDADIVFDQDDGFVSALSQIVQCSKRPIILVTSSMTSQHLQKFFLCGNVVKMHSLLPRMLGTWLDIMCISDIELCWPGFGSRCLDLYRGDIRKSINYMQYLFTSQANMNCDEDKHDSPCIDIEDESSSMSWIDNGINMDDKLGQSVNFFKYDSIEFSYSKNASTLWWNLPKVLLNSEFIDKDLKGKENYKQLSKISDAMDCLSMSDIMTRTEERNCVLTDPWQTFETDNVQECDNYNEYSSYTNQIIDVTNSLIESSLRRVNNKFAIENIDVCLPGNSKVRSKNQVISRHHTLTDSFSKSAILNRRALATDYWSACRSICRIERDKIDNNSKRKNRFFHYLRSMKVACVNDSFDVLCNSLEK